MKPHCLLIVSLILSMPAIAQSDKKYNDADHFLLKGSVYEIDHLEDTEGKAKSVPVVIFQDDEIYVAFNTGQTNGVYEFYLPINHEYNICYGGDTYVNKIVNVDSKQFPSEKKPRTVKLNVGLFRPIDGYAFEMMKDPFVKVKYNVEMDTIEPDMEYTEGKTDQVMKYFRKIKKDMGKKPKDDTKLSKKKSEES